MRNSPPRDAYQFRIVRRPERNFWLLEAIAGRRCAPQTRTWAGIRIHWASQLEGIADSAAGTFAQRLGFPAWADWRGSWLRDITGLFFSVGSLVANLPARGQLNHPLNAKSKCAVSLSPGKDRPGEHITLEHWTRVQEFHDELHKNAGNQTEKTDPDDLLSEATRVCLCATLSEDGIMAAAEQQREVEPQTPPAKSHKPPQLKFQKYVSPRAKSTRDEEMMVDEEVRAKLTGKITKVDKTESHLYVFTSPEAEGFCKVGRGQYISRPTKEYEGCYPDHKLHCFVKCPNINLFESVVHAEFLLYRRTHDCSRCGRRHKEWIEAPLEDVEGSIRAWSRYAQELYKRDIEIDKIQRTPLPKFSDRADRWRNWASQEADRWENDPRGRIHSVSRECVQRRNRETMTTPEYDCETTSKNEYFSDSPPGLSDSPGATPGSEEIREPPTPPTPTPVGRGLAMDKHIRKQTNALGNPEEEAGWEDATTKPIARALFIDHNQHPSAKGQTLLRAEDSALHVSLTKGRSKNNEGQHPEPSTEGANGIQGILNAEIDKKLREVLARVVTEAQVTSAGSLKALGTIHLLSLESAKGLYRVCCRSGSRGLSPEKECYDNATPFRDIPNYTAVKKLLLAEFGVPAPVRKCERCSKTHRDWIKVPEEDIKTSTETQKEPVNLGGLDVHDHSCELSKGPDRWTGERDKVAETQDKTAVEDVPINIPPSKTPVNVDLGWRNAPEGKTKGIFGRLRETTGKPAVSTEQQAPGYTDVAIAAVRNVIKWWL